MEEEDEEEEDEAEEEAFFIRGVNTAEDSQLRIRPKANVTPIL